MKIMDLSQIKNDKQDEFDELKKKKYKLIHK